TKPETRRLLLQRRWRTHGGPARRLEAGVRDADRVSDERMGATARQASGAAHIQPAPRSVRACRLQLEYLLGLDGRSRAPAVCGAGLGGAADRGVRRVPATPEAGVVQPGRGDGAGVEAPPLRYRVLRRSIRRARGRRAPDVAATSAADRRVSAPASAIESSAH